MGIITISTDAEEVRKLLAGDPTLATTTKEVRDDSMRVCLSAPFLPLQLSANPFLPSPTLAAIQQDKTTNRASC